MKVGDKAFIVSSLYSRKTSYIPVTVVRETITLFIVQRKNGSQRKFRKSDLKQYEHCGTWSVPDRLEESTPEIEQNYKTDLMIGVINNFFNSNSINELDFENLNKLYTAVVEAKKSLENESE